MLQEDSYAGKQYGNYRIIRLLARGGYGNVYLAEHSLLPRMVAIKFLHAELCSSPQKQYAFLHEARLLETLKHPHILPIYDVNISNEDFPSGLIVEYAPGGSLRERQRRLTGPMSGEEMLTILEQIVTALQHAHQQITPVVHRDLKPENILFNSQGKALLSDFGIAVVLESSATQQVDVAGTLPYMAPEQFKGLVSPRSDQYALGCLTYELLTGHRPIIAESGQWTEWALRHQKDQPTAPSRLNPLLPSAVDDVILKALSKDRTQRFATVKDFARALRQALQEPINVHSPKSVAPAAFSLKQVPAQPPKQISLPSPEQNLVQPSKQAPVQPPKQAPLLHPEQVPAQASTVPTPRIEPEPRVLQDRAYYLYAHKRYNEALELFEQVISRDPRNAFAYYGKGLIMLDQERYMSAIEAFEQAIVRNPALTPAYLGKASALFNIRAYRRALDAYEQALSHNPSEIDAHYGKADALLKLKRPTEARLAYQAAIQYDTSDRHEERKGNALIFLERYDEALALYDRLIQHSPDNPDLFECRGNILKKLGRIHEADQAYARASELRGYV